MGETHEATARRSALTAALAKVAKGERPALEQVYRATSAKLLGIVIRIVPDREVAEDILQDVYLKVWRRAGRFDPAIASPITWLSVIARNSAIDEARRRARPAEAETAGTDDIERLADDTALADELMCDAEDYAAVRRCLDALENNQRRSIRMAFFGGLTHSELARRAGVPLGTLKSWIRRGLSSLKGCMGFAHD